jgi:hypothetical protein
MCTSAYIHPDVLHDEKMTTLNKMKDKNKMPIAHSGTFACPNAQANVLQAKEPELTTIKRD